MRYRVNILLDNLENKTEHQLAYVIRYFQNLSAEALTRSSQAGGWSIAEVVKHLNTYGDYYLPKIHEAIYESNESEIAEFKSGILGDYFIKMIQPETGTKKLKAIGQHRPGTIEDAHAEVYTLIHQFEQLLWILKQLKGKELGGVRIPTSISRFVKLKLGDVLMFFVYHVDRHLVQVGKLIGTPYQPLAFTAE